MSRHSVRTPRKAYWWNSRRTLLAKVATALRDIRSLQYRLDSAVEQRDAAMQQLHRMFAPADPAGPAPVVDRDDPNAPLVPVFFPDLGVLWRVDPAALAASRVRRGHRG